MWGRYERSLEIFYQKSNRKRAVDTKGKAALSVDRGLVGTCDIVGNEPVFLSISNGDLQPVRDSVLFDDL